MNGDMMVPFDGGSSQQASQHGVAPSMARPPMASGHHGAPSPVMPQQHHGQSMNACYQHPNIHRQHSSGIPVGPNFSIPPSPSSRQGNFGGAPGGGGHYQAHSQPAHHAMRSPANHQQQNHPGMQMHGQPNQASHSLQSHPQHMGMGSGSSQHPNMGSGGIQDNRQRNYIATGMNDNWQSDKDMPHRREMIQQIVKMLKKDKNGSAEWLNKLPQMAKQLEVSLYRNARSFDDYMDMTTLKQRLQLIAMEVSRKSKTQGGSSSSGEHRSGTGGGSSSSNMYVNNGGMHAPQHQEMMRVASQGGGSQSPYMGNQAQSSHSMPQPHQQQMMQQQQQVTNQRQRQVNMDDINPMVGNVSGVGNDMMRASSSGNYMGTSSRNSASLPSSASRSSGASSSNALPQRNDPEWKIRIRHKQQRLLLLHHSAKCHHENGTCSVTPHCADMKRLWRHMEGCKDNNCRVPHCFSSRAILSHYRKCKDVQCPACGPVRETVRKAAKSGTSASSRNSSQHAMMRPSGQSNVVAVQNQMNGAAFPPNNRISSSNTQGHNIVSTSPDPIMPSNITGHSFGSTSSNSNFQPQQQRPVSQSTSMPPPASGPSTASGMQFPTSSYHSSGQSGTNISTSSQSIFQEKSDAVTSSGRIDTMSSAMLRPSPNTASVTGIGSSSSTGSGGQNSTEWQKVRHKQQRLLLLRHASKCQFEAGKCTVTPHCASMKKLWEHIAHCKNQQCIVQHCMSSRYVLSHYRRCKDPRCPACGPVRETIRKSHEKEKGAKGENGGSMEAISMEISNMPSSGAIEAQAMPSISASSSEPRQKKLKIEHSGSMPSVGKPQDIARTEGSVPATMKSRAIAPVVEVKSSEKAPPSGGSTKNPKLDDHSLLNSFSTKEIELHLASLHRAVQMPPQKLKAKCSEILKGLQSHQHGWVFNTPVDPKELGLPDYFDIVKKPMDLGTIAKKIDSGAYHFIEDFATDVKLTFENAMAYNEDGSVVHDMAKDLKAKFLADHKKLLLQLEAEDREARKNDRACTLCGCEKLLFEPPVFFCNGMNCQSQRIRRNSHFYIGGNGQYFWCNQCYNELDGGIPIELVDMTVMKNDLKKKKNDEVHEESWVQCDECESWIHQICGLFNTRQNKEHHSKYFCPKCLLKKRKTGLPQHPRPPSAADLPRTKLSEFLERHVHRKVAERKTRLAKEKVETEKIQMRDALKQLECGEITIRQVTATDRKLEVRELMKKRYSHKNYPDEFPYRCKCIVVFQKIDGVDVILFALYVYEHGADNPPPNQRCVYVSYLDSVHFMRPRQLRTVVYHELLICYLDYVRQKGFATAHIWACPPLKGDDYIFYAKPEDQKTPKDARLRQWYIDMLIEAQKRNICGKLTNMYDHYLANEKLDATAMPYLEGDYFPGEAENIIKELEDGGGKKGSGGGKKSKKKSNKAKSRGNRSDDDSPYGDETKSFKEGGRDEVMVKLGETISPMKDSFIVAFLNWSGAKPEDLVVPDDVAKIRKQAEDDGSAEAERNKRKRDMDGNVKDSNGNPVKVIDDDDEDMDCEFLNNRQAFLNLCRGNHYQFDELRRAKHTSMMVLWHLHNRDAPKFVQQCASCSREILTGTRYHCNTCPDYDLCEECHRNPKANRGACNHRLQPIAVEADNSQERGGTNGLTEEQRRERQRNLQLHIQLIEHASRCNSPSCTSSNCAKMKSYLLHGRSCKMKASGGCKICKRIWTLLRIHAQKCKETVCPIPQCMAIREKIRQLAKQQQAMDDRRRQEMNRAFRMSITSQQGG